MAISITDLPVHNRFTDIKLSPAGICGVSSKLSTLLPVLDIKNEPRHSWENLSVVVRDTSTSGDYQINLACLSKYLEDKQKSDVLVSEYQEDIVQGTRKITKTYKLNEPTDINLLKEL